MSPPDERKTCISVNYSLFFLVELNFLFIFALIKSKDRAPAFGRLALFISCEEALIKSKDRAPAFGRLALFPM
jgi:hypothetical protein